jgi:hypothetical protein
MSNLIAILPEQIPASERVANVLAAASALISGVTLLLAVVIAY